MDPVFNALVIFYFVARKLCTHFRLVYILCNLRKIYNLRYPNKRIFYLLYMFVTDNFFGLNKSFIM